MKEININNARSQIPSLAIVVPCYNEKDAFPYCLEGLTTVLKTSWQKKKSLEIVISSLSMMAVKTTPGNKSNPHHRKSHSSAA
jgi:hypothetical protein